MRSSPRGNPDEAPRRFRMPREFIGRGLPHEAIYYRQHSVEGSMPVRIIAHLDDEAFQDSIRELHRRVRNLRPLLQEIGEEMVEATKERFRTQRDPQGRPWRPLSPKTRKYKRKNQDKILTLDARLRNSIIYQVRGNRVIWGSSLAYAAAHQLGVDRIVHVREHVRRIGRGRGRSAVRVRSHRRPMRLPARPFLGVSAEDFRTIERLVRKHLQLASL